MAIDPGSPIGILVFTAIFAFIYVFVFGTKNVFLDPDQDLITLTG